MADGVRSFQLLLKIILIKFGYQVTVCGSGTDASDYITIPYNKEELVERIEHVLRESEANNS